MRGATDTVVALPVICYNFRLGSKCRIARATGRRAMAHDKARNLPVRWDELTHARVAPAACLSRSSIMQVPFQIRFHNMAASAAIEAKVRERVARLERFSDGIVSCR